ncbi:hypothetical protein DPMN_003563 [Dreissena polymorpha]|uniref:Uncharacterized protein n=1 Tax=Dreissena polymorpha TaxID=45954 RepID=A0A9D4MQW9_DREPO|nr:hypothetical protein DPMN_003563 [Dreissena polymorpha]
MPEEQIDAIQQNKSGIPGFGVVTLSSGLSFYCLVAEAAATKTTKLVPSNHRTVPC